MLPKVATHILHHTSRAAAAAQNYTFRNVLGLQSSNAQASSPGGLSGWNTSTGSSSWGAHGAGAGGPKQNAGSRFYSGYSGPGRAVTQANSSTGHDANAGQNDDSDDLKPRRLPRLSITQPRPRRRSITFGTNERPERAEALGVLKTVQFHQARARHALAEQLPMTSELVVPYTPLDRSEVINAPSSPPRTLVRRNSTSASSYESDSRPLSPLSPPSPLVSPVLSLPPTDPAAPQTALPPTPPPSSSDDDSTIASEIRKRLQAVTYRSDHFDRIAGQAKRMRSLSTDLSVGDFNIAMRALLYSRPPGHPITLILETYNDMLSRDLVPNIVTYKILIEALALRDVEVNKVIHGLQARMKRRETINQAESTRHEEDAHHLAQLKAEDNLSSAKALFDVAKKLHPRFIFPQRIYIELLRACAAAADVDAAIRIFSHIEKSEEKASLSIYFQLMRTFINANDLDGAKDVFQEYRSAAKEARLLPDMKHGQEDNETANFTYLAAGKDNDRQRYVQVLLWNKMIETHFLAGQPERAIGLLEEMLDNNGGIGCSVDEIPPPSSATYATFVDGFINSGDMTSALAWFDRMLAQEGASPKHPLQSTIRPPRPDQLTWSIMIEALAAHRMRDDLNRLFRIQRQTAEHDGVVVRAVDRMLVLEVNHMHLVSGTDISQAEAKNTVEFLINEVLELNPAQPSETALELDGIRTTLERLLNVMAQYHMYDRALDLIETYAKVEKEYVLTSEMALTESREHLFGTKGVRSLMYAQTTNLLDRPDAGPDYPLTLDYVFRFAEISRAVGLSISARVAPYYLHTYYLAKERGEIVSLTANGWGNIILSVLIMEHALNPTEKNQLVSVPDGFQYQGLLALIDDLHKYNVRQEALWSGTIVRLCSALFDEYGSARAEELLAKLGDDWTLEARKIGGRHTAQVAVFESSPIVEAPTDHKRVRHIDLYHGRFIDEWYPQNSRVSPETALRRFRAGKKRGVYPPPEILGRLINGLGRKGDLKSVRELYADSQAVLAALEHDKKWQAGGWYSIEDHMITALAQAGDVDSAHVHRQRILDHGGVPTAEAYGSLIHSVKETTDDSSAALQLWYEAEARGVVPNVYMYNTMISKLSKARKADFALELFQQMKANNVRPTSVTYGAVVAACCRVGDANSAELLFEEMTQQPNFKPRHPPFNTMIQLYTQVKPNRERVMFYFNELVKAGIAPTAHTYKLLLDCHGTVEPVDMNEMQKVFQQIADEPKMTVQGVHWAALINAWGCVKKDLDMAQQVFDSIANHPSTKKSRLALPDAVTYEAMFNVLVTLRRPDLIQSYLDRLQENEVHMTAYIANLLIKGFASANQMDKAREIFESMEDAPVGVAAPGNHTPHEAGAHGVTAPGAPVYREPSTWEAMFRAELGGNYRKNALQLLERFKARQFPPAVFHRISGIMHDDLESPPTA